MNRSPIALVLGALLILVGCGGDNDRPASGTPAVDADARESLFERIDADSIYVFANAEAMPEALSERLWASLEQPSVDEETLYDTLLETIEHPLARALVNEIMAIDGREALESRGLHSNGLVAIHGISLYPVMHWQLIDHDAFAATLERIADEADMALPWRGIDDEQVMWIDLGNFGLAIHHDEHFLTAAIVPDDRALLRRIADLDRPSEAFTVSDLRAFNRERGYTAHGSGYFDLQRLVDRLLDTDDELARAARQAADIAPLVDDPACQRELRALSGVFPRISSGSTRLTDREIAASMMLETDRALGERLAAIADAPVPLEADEDAMFSAGLAFNMIAARDLAREIVGGWVDNPPECALFADIRDNAADWQLAVNRPIPPIVTNLQGLRLSVDHLELEGMGQLGDVRGNLAVFMRNPQMMIGMAQMFSPELAALDLRPGGDPQPLPPGLIPDMPELGGWVAMGENSIGLAVGDDQKDKLSRMLQTGSSDSAILYYGMDFGAYANLMSDMMEQTRARLEAMDEDFDVALGDQQAVAAMGEIYDYSEVSIHLRPHGIELNSLLRLKD